MARCRLRCDRFCVLMFATVYSTGMLWLIRSHDVESHPNSGRKDLLNKIKRLEEENAHLHEVFASARRRYPELSDDVNARPRGSNYSKSLPTIYVVTPTYTRPVQKAELTRISQTFNQVRGFHWIVVEDAMERTKLVGNLLRRSGIEFTHLNCKGAEQLPPQNAPPRWKPSRGFEQRNTAIEWLLKNVNSSDEHPGVVYFADDDNTYDLRLFEEMRYTRRVSIWPVGLVGARMYERPRLDSNGTVSGWHVGWGSYRPFAVDMAAFAINLKIFEEAPWARFSLESTSGYVESDLLSSLSITKEDLEPKADNCTKIYVWHTRTNPTKLSYKLERTNGVEIEV